jgi:hypothetical protein
MWYIILAVVALAAGYWLRARFAPKPPVPPALPEPKKFGLREAEDLSGQLHGLTADQATAARLAVVGCGVRYVLDDEVAKVREDLAASRQKSEQTIEECKRTIAFHESRIGLIDERNGELTNLAAAFGVSS